MGDRTELQYALDFIKQGIAQKSARLNVLLTHSENICPEDLTLRKLKKQILELEIIAKGYEQRLLREKINQLNGMQHALEIQKPPLLKEAALLLHKLLGPQYTLVLANEHRTLNERIFELEVRINDTKKNLSETEKELTQAIQDEARCRCELAALAKAPLLLHAWPSRQPISPLKAAEKESTSTQMGCSPPLTELLGLPDNATLEDMYAKMQKNVAQQSKATLAPQPKPLRV